ncbi:hypothetical protein [Acinetobacter sp.]|uniref:hypothetical protein n=1 Tax=Acinetobacter sp. TaxID=472 RepID=UPI000C0A2F03|nr:hypothetical protein [Acinetobacter sp.]MAK29840.1 hypothetical protein [Acinetobacter sp.]|tara:strand:- start:843 stop:1313 length:471 start_codon:yes stop_codon:yes gene_type:complete
MPDKQELKKKEQKLAVRNQILKLEEELLKLVDGKNVVAGDSDVFPLKHTFADGIYIREMKMKAGRMVIGKIHKHLHAWFLLTGSISVVTETSIEDFIAPCYVVAPKGSKRVIYAHEDCIWVNVHANPSNTRDLVELEENLIAKNYKDYEEYINKNK